MIRFQQYIRERDISNCNYYYYYYYYYYHHHLSLWSSARAMTSCGSAAQCGLWPPLALQPSVGCGLLWLCSPAWAMASCGSAAQRELWPPVTLQPTVGYGLL
jgi:hypothetical protein